MNPELALIADHANVTHAFAPISNDPVNASWLPVDVVDVFLSYNTVP